MPKRDKTTIASFSSAIALKAMREQLGLTKCQMALKIDMRASGYYRYEDGAVSMTFETFLKHARKAGFAPSVTLTPLAK